MTVVAADRLPLADTDAVTSPLATVAVRPEDSDAAGVAKVAAAATPTAATAATSAPLTTHVRRLMTVAPRYIRA